MKPRLALFDLDHTLLLGDSDVLWCDFLIAEGLLDRAAFAVRNADMESRYQAGTVGVDEFAGFYVSTLAGRSPLEWEPLRRRFLHEQVVPRIPPGALDLVRQERAAGALVVLTTATNRYITELTAAHLGIDHLLATEAQQQDGLFTGGVYGPPNMRAGKVRRLQDWLAQRGSSLAGWHSIAYSDSSNDLPLLEAADEAVAVEPDPQLAAIARQRAWRVIRWNG
ncbi:MULTISPECIES: HAD-IB family hydrolase [Ramlibacter]|uniref:HAD-IB family hydrolase n=1 Tax=Ramlibacter pinisoli TaxID=2682844 RepID=A0A6N8J0S3_9BURK|nr:HAD-IB family hydrolase [Ramlibacter sp. CGMCC 1.13660]MVQ32435.1 HAD-IB family hydrolase [Ramlibacter pinisoli]